MANRGLASFPYVYIGKAGTGKPSFHYVYIGENKKKVKNYWKNMIRGKTLLPAGGGVCLPLTKHQIWFTFLCFGLNELISV